MVVNCVFKNNQVKMAPAKLFLILSTVNLDLRRGEGINNHIYLLYLMEDWRSLRDGCTQQSLEFLC